MDIIDHSFETYCPQFQVVLVVLFTENFPKSQIFLKWFSLNDFFSFGSLTIFFSFDYLIDIIDYLIEISEVFKFSKVREFTIKRNGVLLRCKSETPK